MSHSNTRGGCVVGVCFMFVWCSIAFGIGITALQMGAPIIFTLAPFGMGAFGIVMCITIARKGRMAYPRPRRSFRDYPTYTGDSMGVEHSPPQHEKRSYQAPSTCPSCGASISTNEVDWVAPLKAVCPYCETVMDAVERY